MDGLNARLEGFAREQLSQGRGTMSIIHELARMGHIGIEDARAIVEQARPSVLREAPRRGRGMFLFGLVILSIPVAIVLSLRFVYGITDALVMFLALPMLLPEVIGLATVAYGLSVMRRPKTSIDPAAPRGPASTGLWWRADPFEWK